MAFWQSRATSCFSSEGYYTSGGGLHGFLQMSAHTGEHKLTMWLSLPLLSPCNWINHLCLSIFLCVRKIFTGCWDDELLHNIRHPFLVCCAICVHFFVLLDLNQSCYCHCLALYSAALFVIFCSSLSHNYLWQHCYNYPIVWRINWVTLQCWVLRSRWKAQLGRNKTKRLQPH